MPTLRRRLLEPLAARHGLSYDEQILAPGTTPPEKAYQLVTCGADLLVGLAYPDEIQTHDRRVARKTAKRVARRYGTESGARAAIFLAQAFATHSAELHTELGTSRARLRTWLFAT